MRGYVYYSDTKFQITLDRAVVMSEYCYSIFTRTSTVFVVFLLSSIIISPSVMAQSDWEEDGWLTSSLAQERLENGDEFGCYGLIGPESPFQSEKIRAWVVYMPRNFYYPWHQHPAEEMYFCIAGEAIFRRETFPHIRLSSGGTIEHLTNQSHSMETLDHPIMAYVVWRNEFGTKPILTYKDAR